MRRGLCAAAAAATQPALRCCQPAVAAHAAAAAAAARPAAAHAPEWAQLRQLRTVAAAAALWAPAAQQRALRPPARRPQRRWCAAGAGRADVRNISVIAHVDHGKTTLVDAMLQQTSGDKKVKGTRVMDSHELEAERGITILAKNTSIQIPGCTINIVDTPGHADFAGEVERAIQMVEGFILLVDAAEGPKPGTRYVLKKSLEMGLKPIVCINKVDRASQDDIDKTRDSIESLFLELACSEDQLEYPVLYGSGKNGYMNADPTKREGTLGPLWDTVLKTVPAPAERKEGHLQLLIASVDFDDRGKRLAVGRVFSGTVKTKDEVFITDFHDNQVLGSFKVTELMKFDGLDKTTVQEALFGDIICLRGENLDKAGLKIGHTLQLKNQLSPVPYKALDEPTFAVTLHPNRSPLKGADGQRFGGSEIRTRLEQEAVKNLAMRINIVNADEFKVWGRGLLHLGVLFEEMRRQGFEMELAKPTVATKEINGKKHEPWERLVVRCHVDTFNDVSAPLYAAQGQLERQTDIDGGWTESVWVVPGRCMIGLNTKIQAAANNVAELEQTFAEYRPWDDSFSTRRDCGSLLANGDGEVTSEGLKSISHHGVSFVSEKDKCYRDMIVGRRDGKSGDLELNVCKGANHFASKIPTSMAADKHNLESALAYIQDDEFVEVTPRYVRMRKKPRTDKERKEALRG
eukprot:TRINITY_DN8066_c1_g1_i1.p1 TRINITY_DN8066_c1_g1~~TRINITY_DN8066_c1_g1_i1.p1  ORF type:complete len:689 (+),score=277.74 TRINITY_DN8066_c1_g1_i1:131-2197(+)